MKICNKKLTFRIIPFETDASVRLDLNWIRKYQLAVKLRALWGTLSVPHSDWLTARFTQLPGFFNLFSIENYNITGFGIGHRTLPSSIMNHFSAGQRYFATILILKQTISAYTTHRTTRQIEPNTVFQWFLVK